MSGGVRLGFDGVIGRTNLTVGLLTANYNSLNPIGASQPVGFEVDLKADDFEFWTEYASTDKKTGYYGIFSYAFAMGKEAQLIPFLTIDSYRDDSTNTKADFKNRRAVGVNYRPKPTISTKFEYLRTDAQSNGTGGYLSSPSTDLNLSVSYFFN
jgi:hypothetical protein